MGNILEENKIMNAFSIILPYLPIFLDNDVSIVLTDKEHFIKRLETGNLHVPPTPDEVIPPGGAIAEAIRTGKVLIKDVPKHVYGIPFRSYAVPIKNEQGVVEGSIVVAKSISKSAEVLEISHNLSEALEQISVAINSLSSDVQGLVGMNAEVISLMDKTTESTKGTNDILSFIQGIASQTNLLGLNAAIEAARAGEQGKGFNVVAQEIRTLSSSTADSVKKINVILKDIESSINNISTKVGDSNSVYETQAASFQEIAASLEELNSTAQILKSLSEKL